MNSLRTIKSAGIEYTGMKNQITFIEKNSIKTAFAGFCWKPCFNNLLDLSRVREIVARAEEKSDVVVITFHGGSERAEFPFMIMPARLSIL